MRFQLIVFCLATSSLLIAQQTVSKTIDVQEFSSDLSLQNKDSIPVEKKNLTEGKKDSLMINLSRKKRFIPYFKSMDEVSIKDYKLLFLDGSEMTVDTSLSLEREYTFNFLRKDYFEFLTFPNMGEAFNKLGYNFHDQPFTPQMGARV